LTEQILVTGSSCFEVEAIQAAIFRRYRKFVARDTAKNPADPFIDPESYRIFIDNAEKEFRQGQMY
jgi:hypothetical protein